jgi:hypothetical protein
MEAQRQAELAARRARLQDVKRAAAVREEVRRGEVLSAHVLRLPAASGKPCLLVEHQELGHQRGSWCSALVSIVLLWAEGNCSQLANKRAACMLLGSMYGQIKVNF